MHVFRVFAKYVSLNILGMIGISCYILADTFFISKALGTAGIAALNLSIPVYSVIHGMGLMIGIGGAARFSILKSRNKYNKVDAVFSASIKIGTLMGVIFVITGIFGVKKLALVLGADLYTLPLTQTYLTTILCFAPFYIINNVVITFVRNDNNPSLSMIAMLSGSFSNIVLDYLFIFPLGMGMFGAAFATGVAPIISLCVLSIHFLRKKNSFEFIYSRIICSSICDIFKLGSYAFITEVSSAVVLITYNIVILSLRGSLGVAAYGIIANIALVGVSIFIGIAQGAQPLISKSYGLKNYEVLRKVRKYALITSFFVALIVYLGMFFCADSVVRVFNSQNNLEMAQIAEVGLRIYFLGFFFIGINIIIAMCLSSTENAKEAFIISILRGCIIIIPLVIILSKIWSMIGIWIAFVLTELIVTIIAVYITYSRKALLIKKKIV